MVAWKGYVTKKVTPPTKRKKTAEPLTLVKKKGVGSEMFQSIAELGNDGILVFDENCEIEFANRMASEITGYPSKKLLKMSVLSLLDKPHQAFVEDLFIHPERYGEKSCIEVKLLSSNGERKEAEICIVLAETHLGGRKGYAYIRDITERLRYEKELRDSEEKLRTLFERVRHGLFISSKEGRFIECNQALIDMLGYPDKKESPLGKISPRISMSTWQIERCLWRGSKRKTMSKTWRSSLRKRTEEKITVLLTAYPIKNESGEIVGYEGINLDISERKRIEKSSGKPTNSSET